MDDLIAFVTARLDEDEAEAQRNAGAGPGWTHGLGDTEETGPSWPDYQTFDGDDITAASAYLDRFRPLRMLREVAAKRKRLASYIAARAAADRHDDQYMAGVASGLADAVKDDADAWSDHPDYRAEWAPEGATDR